MRRAVTGVRTSYVPLKIGIDARQWHRFSLTFCDMRSPLVTLPPKPAPIPANSADTLAALDLSLASAVRNDSGIIATLRHSWMYAGDAETTSCKASWRTMQNKIDAPRETNSNTGVKSQVPTSVSLKTRISGKLELPTGVGECTGGEAVGDVDPEDSPRRFFFLNHFRHLASPFLQKWRSSVSSHISSPLHRT